MTSFVDIALKQSTNDIAHKGGKILYVSAVNELMQRIKTCLRRIRGEWFLDINAGLPYFGGNMLGGKDLEYVKLVIRQEVEKVTGLASILDVQAIMRQYSKKVEVSVKIQAEEKIYIITEELQ